MFIYSFNYILILFGSIIFKNKNFNKYENIYWLLLLIYLYLFIGLRYEIGGDWEQYQYHFNFNSNLPLIELSFELTGDIAYLLLVKISNFLNTNIIFVNLLSALIIIYCLKYFTEKSKNKFLALLTLYPYFIVVVILGYNRQGIAASIFLLSIIYFLERKFFLLLLSLFFATMFHKSAIICFLIFFLYPNNMNKEKIFFVGAILLSVISILYFFIFYDSINRGFFYFLYEPHFTSSGVYFRLLFYLLPVLIIFIFYNFLNFTKFENRLYVITSILVIFSIPFSYYFSSFIDRILVYFIFLQPLIITKFYYNLSSNVSRVYFFLTVSLFYFFYMMIWFVFSDYSEWWVPYNFDINIFKYSTNIIKH
tara:strand:- start:317 stop:1411 length:1095 start_codon:yes stop_codon:yes gene_type:complete